MMTGSILETGVEGDSTGDSETSGDTVAEVYVREDGSLYLTNDFILNGWYFCIWHTRH